MIGLFVGLLFGLLFAPRAIRKADERLGEFSIVDQTWQHAKWTAIYFLPYLLAGMVATIALVVFTK